MRRLSLVILLFGTLFCGCGHKTHLRPPEPKRVQKVESFFAEVQCGQVNLKWKPVFFDNRGNPLEKSASYLVLRRRGAPVEMTGENKKESAESNNSEAEQETESGKVINDVSVSDADEAGPDEAGPDEAGNADRPDILPVEYEYSLIAVVPGVETTLNDPGWTSEKISWNDTSLPSGPIWTLKNRKYVAPKDFPPKDFEDEDRLVPGYTYYYIIVAVSDEGITSEASGSVQVPWMIIPGAPTEFGFELAQNKVTITWKAPVVDCDDNEMKAPSLFEVFRGKKDGDETSWDNNYMARVEEEQFVDETIEMDAVYEYAVRSVMDPPSIPGEFTGNLEVKTADVFAPSVPGGLSGAVSMLGVYLNWRHVNDGDLAGYNIYRRMGSEGEFQRLNEDKPVETNTYTDEAVQSGHAYEYRITSVDRSEAANESDPGVSWAATIK